eukprot:gnl/MRDRNA2_/MRDRNA2_58523_c0_seq2.p1 gnl/MRDRNA2_/MRDRNA2_58523_c0~~gnl/MRDRNA2_/MRDRNA2_58523_c0_seq2.p1  ORF type:complete len:771 (-),score=110.06 gnl/MRDRNA2_/MRDRNA2_58523_c0_seq2:400-2712(-)
MIQGIPFEHWYGFAPFCQLYGSVIYNTGKLALVPGLIAFSVKLYLHSTNQLLWMDKDFLSTAYSGFCGFLGFVLVFRSIMAYNRYWDAVKFTGQMTGHWYNAAAHLCSFAVSSGKSKEEVTGFMECVVRLFSLLHAYAWQEIAVQEDEDFEVVDCEGLGDDLRAALREEDNPQVKKEWVHQWVQQVVLEGLRSGVLQHMPAPITSVVWQELNLGMDAANQMILIAQCPFPFPYAQMISYALIIFCFVTIVFVCGMDVYPHTAFLGVFAFTSTCFALNLIASEIEMPFGDDQNDLNGFSAQMEMNKCLMNLIKPVVQKCPKITLERTGSRSIDLCGVKRLSHSMSISKTALADSPRQSLSDKSCTDEGLTLQAEDRASTPSIAVGGGHGTLSISEKASSRGHPETNNAIVPDLLTPGAMHQSPQELDQEQHASKWEPKPRWKEQQRQRQQQQQEQAQADREVEVINENEGSSVAHLLQQRQQLPKRCEELRLNGDMLHNKRSRGHQRSHSKGMHSKPYEKQGAARHFPFHSSPSAIDTNRAESMPIVSASHFQMQPSHYESSIEGASTQPWQQRSLIAEIIAEERYRSQGYRTQGHHQDGWAQGFSQAQTSACGHHENMRRRSHDSVLGRAASSPFGHGHVIPQQFHLSEPHDDSSRDHGCDVPQESRSMEFYHGNSRVGRHECETVVPQGARADPEGTPEITCMVRSTRRLHSSEYPLFDGNMHQSPHHHHQENRTTSSPQGKEELRRKSSEAVGGTSANPFIRDAGSCV